MQEFNQLVSFLTENRTAVGSFMVALLTILKLSSWGRAKAKALDVVVHAIEEFGTTQVKTSVARKEFNLEQTAKDAIKHAVAKADKKKKPESAISRAAREIFRGDFLL